MIEYYRKQKAEVISALKRLNNTVSNVKLAGADGVVQVVNAAIDRLEHNKFNLAVCGIVKRGKSTFINSLLGEEILPAGIIPVTSVVTYLRHGKGKTAVVRFADGREKIIRFDEMSQYCSESLNRQNKKQVESLDITYPSKYLTDGVVIADTPGVGSIHQNHTEFVYGFLPQADAIIFVFTVDPPIDHPELAFLKDVVAQPRKLMFVQTKVDKSTPQEVEESRAYLYQVLEEQTSLGHPPVYPISARQALEARRTGDSTQLEASGLPAFEKSLDHFLMNEKGRAALESAISTGLERSAMVLQALKLRIQFINSKGNVALQKSKEIDARLANMRETMGNINADLQREWKIATDAYKDKVGSICYGLVRQLKDEAYRYPDSNLAAYIRQAMTERIAPVYQELDQRVQEVYHRALLQARTVEANTKEELVQSLLAWEREDGGSAPAGTATDEEGEGADQSDADQSNGGLPVPTTPGPLATLPTWDWDSDLGPVASWAAPVGLTALLFFGPLGALAAAAAAGFIAYQKQYNHRHREAKLQAIEELADSLRQQAVCVVQERIGKVFDDISQSITGQLESSIEVIGRQLRQAQQEAHQTNEERAQLLQSLRATGQEIESVIHDLQRIRLDLANQALQANGESSGPHVTPLESSGLKLKGRAGLNMANGRA